MKGRSFVLISFGEFGLLTFRKNRNNFLVRPHRCRVLCKIRFRKVVFKDIDIGKSVLRLRLGKRRSVSFSRKKVVLRNLFLYVVDNRISSTKADAIRQVRWQFGGFNAVFKQHWSMLHTYFVPQLFVDERL